MNEQEQGGHKHSDTRENHADVPPGAQQEQAFHSKVVADDRHHNKKEHFRDIPLKDRLLVEITIGAILIAGVTAWILQRQAGVMSDTLAEIRGSGRQAERSLRLQRGQVIQAAKQAKAATDSVSEIQRQTRLGQRPWLKIEFYGESRGSDPSPKNRWTTFTSGSPLQVPVRITNVGNTAALRVHGFIVVEVVPVGKEPSIPSKKKSGHVKAISAAGLTTSVIYRDGWVDIPASRKQQMANGKIEDATLTRPEAIELNGGTAYVVIWGKVRYTDIFGTHHWTKYCGAISSSGGYMQSDKCPAYGDVDSN